MCFLEGWVKHTTSLFCRECVKFLVFDVTVYENTQSRAVRQENRAVRCTHHHKSMQQWCHNPVEC